jgi:ribonucleotide reductase alpha subunit
VGKISVPQKVRKRDHSIVQFDRTKIERAIERAAYIEDVRKIYRMAHKFGLKGITIYRYGSKEQQVLSFVDQGSGQPMGRSDFVVAESEYSGGCLTGACPF